MRTLPINALIEFLLEVFAHNPAELYEHLKNTESKKTEMKKKREMGQFYQSFHFFLDNVLKGNPFSSTTSSQHRNL